MADQFNMDDLMNDMSELFSKHLGKKPKEEEEGLGMKGASKVLDILKRDGQITPDELKSILEEQAATKPSKKKKPKSNLLDRIAKEVTTDKTGLDVKVRTVHSDSQSDRQVLHLGMAVIYLMKKYDLRTLKMSYDEIAEMANSHTLGIEGHKHGVKITRLEE